MKQFLESKRNFSSQNRNFNIPINLESSYSELSFCDIQKTIDDAKRYYIEKNKSCCYKIQGSITPIFSNELIQIQGNCSLQAIQEFANEKEIDDYKTLIKQENGWYYFLLDDCTKKFFEPSKKRFDLCDKSKWCIDIFVDSSCDDTFSLNGVELSKGIAIHETEIVELDNRKFTVLYTLHPHNLDINSQIEINSISSITNYNNKFYVKKIGNEVGQFKDNAFMIDVTDITIPNDLYFNRLVNNVPSEYYIKRLKKISANVDVFSLGFSKSFFGDTNLGFNIHGIDLCNELDCFNKPIENIYLGIIKNNASEVDSNGDRYFGRVQSGLDFLANQIDYDITSLDYNNSVLPIDNNVTCEDTEYFYSIFEYNSYEIKEYDLSKVKHRFNSNDRFNNDFYEGLCYTPFHKIKVRNYSSYVEQGSTERTDNIPPYAVPYGEEFRWRDLLEFGFSNLSNEGVEYPFVNGCHHISTNIQMCVNRQDVCNNNQVGLLNPIEGDCIDFEPLENDVEDPC